MVVALTNSPIIYMNTIQKGLAFCGTVAMSVSAFAPVALARTVTAEQSQYLYFNISPRRINSENVHLFNSGVGTTGVIANTNTMNTLADCKVMRSNLVSANNMYKNTDAQALFNCYERVIDSMRITTNTPILTRRTLSNTTGSTYRTQRGRTNRTEMITITERYSEGTGVPNKNATDVFVTDPTVLEDNDNFTDGTGVPTN